MTGARSNLEAPFLKSSFQSIIKSYASCKGRETIDFQPKSLLTTTLTIIVNIQRGAIVAFFFLQVSKRFLVVL